MKAFWGLVASFIAVVLSVVSVAAVDIWQISPFRSYANTSRVRRWMFGQHRS
ncbi:MAG: hypothetical protein ACLGSD_08975 [Acidobacteriota bacterium]